MKGLYAVVVFCTITLVAEGPPPAVPVDPIDALIEACRTHTVVALSEGRAHGDEQGLQFRLALIRDPRFASVVNDIVIEGANARFQDVIDRYTDGEDVPEARVFEPWRESTQVQIALEPVGSPLIQAVREVNRTLPRGRHLRILLGDPPIDWDKVKTSEEFRHWLGMRDSFPAELIRREVLDEARHALVVFGSGHLQRRNQVSNYDMSDPIAQTIVSVLERGGTTKVFVVWSPMNLEAIQADVVGWPVPSFARVLGTSIGSAPEEPGALPRMSVRDGTLSPLPREEWQSIRMEEQIDAVLYLGPASNLTVRPATTAACGDRSYIDQRLARIALVGLPPSEADRLKQTCAAAAR